MRIGELHAELAAKDAKLNAALLAHADFGRPDHALFATGPGFDRAAPPRFSWRGPARKPISWNAMLVKLIGTLPGEKSLPVLRRLWGQAGVDEALLPVLAQHPEAADRDKFLTGLASPQAGDAAGVLAGARGAAGAGHGRQASVAAGAGAAATRRRQGREAVARAGGQVFAARDRSAKLGGDAKAWAAWFSKSYPALAARLNGADGVDVAAWEKRLAKIDWSAGDTERGKVVFTKVNCASCHFGGGDSAPTCAAWPAASRATTC